VILSVLVACTAAVALIVDGAESTWHELGQELLQRRNAIDNLKKTQRLPLTICLKVPPLSRCSM